MFSRCLHFVWVSLPLSAGAGGRVESIAHPGRDHRLSADNTTCLCRELSANWYPLLLNRSSLLPSAAPRLPLPSAPSETPRSVFCFDMEFPGWMPQGRMDWIMLCLDWCVACELRGALLGAPQFARLGMAQSAIVHRMPSADRPIQQWGSIQIEYVVFESSSGTIS